MNTIAQEYLKELEAEAPATRKCLERIPIDKIFDWVPHEKSMKMGYLTVLVADIPNWIASMVDVGVIDFATWKNAQPKTTEEVVKLFDENMIKARKALQNTSDEALKNETFTLKNKDMVLMSTPKGESVSSTLNHWVHHRGQLTVYMRLNNMPVPQIYGPSADEKDF